MASPRTASDYGKLAELTEKHDECEKKMQGLYDEWAAAAEELK
jgi:hypothetical protein